MRSLNEFFGWMVFEELERCGLQNVFIAPGSRSTPLVMGAHAHQKLKKTIHFDERGLSFAALGASKRTLKPSAIITTSGTAVANLYPAIIEAAHAHVPLLILSADRPFELRGTGANQAIDQVRIFGSAVLASYDVPTPNEDLTSVLTLLDEAWTKALEHRGPVHVNFMFKEPLAPPLDGKFETPENLKSWMQTQKPFAGRTARMATAKPSPQELPTDIGNAIVAAKKPVVVAGGHCDVTSVLAVAEKINAPIIADILSGLRFHEHTQVIRNADLLCEKGLPNSDLVIWFGDTLQSKKLNDWLKKQTSLIQITDSYQRTDFQHLSKVWLHGSFFFEDLPAASNSSTEGWLSQWQAMQKHSEHHLSQDREISEITVAQDLVNALSENALLYSASSRPIRDIERYALQTKATLYSNRGTSGIDGNLATFYGLASNHSGPSAALIGDLAFLHDLNSLALLKKVKSPATLTIVDNNGGGIFSFLPIAQHHDVFETYFSTPHDLNIRELLKGFQISFSEPKTRAEYQSELARSLTREGLHVLLYTSDRMHNRNEHRKITESWK